MREKREDPSEIGSSLSLPSGIRGRDAARMVAGMDVFFLWTFR